MPHSSVEVAWLFSSFLAYLDIILMMSSRFIRIPAAGGGGGGEGAGGLQLSTTDLINPCNANMSIAGGEKSLKISAMPLNS